MNHDSSDPHEDQVRSQHILVQKYRVSNHAAIRYGQRIIGMDKWIDEEDLDLFAQAIRKELEPCLKDGMNITVPFLDQFKAVIKNGVVVTIKQNFGSNKEMSKCKKD